MLQVDEGQVVVSEWFIYLVMVPEVLLLYDSEGNLLKDTDNFV